MTSHLRVRPRTGGASRIWRRTSLRLTNSRVGSLAFSFRCLTDGAVAQHDEALFKLANAEVQVEELKVQLDDALGAEEMLVQLTERNLMLGEVRLLLIGTV